MAGDTPEIPDLDDDDSDLDLAGDDAPVADGPLARGAAVIKAFWRHAPLGPGVYRMLGESGEVLYVGKARSIKKRILSYTAPQRQSSRIARMIAETVSMVFVTVETEAESLLLEANLIKQLKPRYNVLLRDDKSFPYILVTGDHEAPRIGKHRGARDVKGDYYGPFASAGAVHRTLSALQRAFLLRTCSDSYYANRTRPCLLLSDQALLGALHGRDLAAPTTPSWSARRAISCPAAAARCAIGWRARWARRRRRWSSSAPRGCATASRRCRRSRASRASTRARCRRRTCSPSPRRPGSSASRRSSSAPIRTGAIALTSRAPTSR